MASSDTWLLFVLPYGLQDVWLLGESIERLPDMRQVGGQSSKHFWCYSQLHSQLCKQMLEDKRMTREKSPKLAVWCSPLKSRDFQCSRTRSVKHTTSTHPAIFLLWSALFTDFVQVTCSLRRGPQEVRDTAQSPFCDFQIKSFDSLRHLFFLTKPFLFHPQT